MAEEVHAGGRILLVEDDPDQVFLLSTFLESQGYTVDACTRTLEALRKYTEEQYFCAILDVMMPDGGAEYILRNTTVSHPIIVLTAAREDRKQDVSKNLGGLLMELSREQ